ncbi:uncharacterized protein VTP21DRAFT_6468 [Calcarisporiella thermophila]|uniref:uncharacterized protein n=1 Tax=Calcarisporiella thermophila TaxID=911321 RepID=UPI0037428178
MISRRLLERFSSYSRLNFRSLGSYSTTRINSDKVFRVLGIETSCDDTSAAVVTSDRRILSEAIHTQHSLHKKMGGVVPNIALRSHAANLPRIVREALDNASLEIEDIDVIAVTRGPGIAPCLSVGMNAAKTLAAVTRKPLIGVHHMEAHALTARLTTADPTQSSPLPEFPFLTLLISGGHTLILVAHSVNNYTQLGTTLDDSIGEAFDKTARTLGLPWPEGRGGGLGVALEQAASKGDPVRFGQALPIPMEDAVHGKGMNFSFSGLKTAVKYMIERQQLNLSDDQVVCDLAAGFQSKAVMHLERKLAKALKWCESNNVHLTSLVVSGGVASNQHVRSRLSQLAGSHQLSLICPPPHLCTDNGVMIAWAGVERYRAGLIDDISIDFIPKWPIENLKEIYQGQGMR